MAGIDLGCVPDLLLSLLALLLRGLGPDGVAYLCQGGVGNDQLDGASNDVVRRRGLPSRRVQNPLDDFRHNLTRFVICE